MGVVLSEIGSRTATTTTTNSDGTTSVTGGLFSGDSAGAQRPAVAHRRDALPGRRPVTVEDRDHVRQGRHLQLRRRRVRRRARRTTRRRSSRIATQLAQRVADAAGGLSDAYDGALTLKISSQQDLVKDYGTQIDDWDRRLALRRETLQATYSALEVTLSNMQSQSSWLSGQLASLPSYSTGS